MTKFGCYALRPGILAFGVKIELRRGGFLAFMGAIVMACHPVLASEKSFKTAYALAFDPLPGDALFYSGHPVQGAINTLLGAGFGSMLAAGIAVVTVDECVPDSLCSAFEGIEDGLAWWTLIPIGIGGYLGMLAWDGAYGVRYVRESLDKPPPGAGPEAATSRSVALTRALGWDAIPGDALFYAGKYGEGVGSLLVGGLGAALLVTGLINAADGRKNASAITEISTGALMYLPALLWDYFGAMHHVRSARSGPSAHRPPAWRVVSVGVGGPSLGLSVLF